MTADVTMGVDHILAGASDAYAGEHGFLDATQKALLNILEDATEERATLSETQRAMINILDDAAEERGRLVDVQRALLNILDDFEREQQKTERMNTELRDEVAVRSRAEKALRHSKAATEAANKELEAFSYSVAHDLRAPLRSIDGFSLALIEDCAEDLQAEGKTYLGHVRDSAQHMSRLIDGLLSLSRLGRTAMHLERIDLVSVARAVFERLRRNDPDRSVELAIPAEMFVVADARLLEIVLENLLGNAWKFTNRLANAHLEVGRLPRAGPLIFFVRDDGAGFDMAYAGKLFAVFQRLHTPSEFDGTGIGLANVERIIHRHGGRIWGESEVGRGATFFFTLEEDA
jgi:light-regulated signal transduction histidine kinase (bacteriophytochrome)